MHNKKNQNRFVAYYRFNVDSFRSAAVVIGDDEMTKLCVIAFIYIILSYYTALLIALKAKKKAYRLLPLLYVIAGVTVTLVGYDGTDFFPELTLLFFGVPTLLSVVYICLAYIVVYFGGKKKAKCNPG